MFVCAVVINSICRGWDANSVFSLLLIDEHNAVSPDLFWLLCVPACVLICLT